MENPVMNPYIVNRENNISGEPIAIPTTTANPIMNELIGRIKESKAIRLKFKTTHENEI